MLIKEGIDKKAFAAGEKALKAYAMKNGGIDKADFMDVSKMLGQISRVNILQAGQLLSTLNRKVDGMDTDVRERIYIELKKVGLMESKDLQEKMTEKQMKKREEIVKSMKKNKADFEDRYGDRAKDVMYATATKMAMDEEIERRADVKMVKVKQPDGRVVMRKQRPEVKIGESVEEAVDAKKVVVYLVKKGNNPKAAESMVKKELAGAMKAYPNAPVAKIADYIRSVAEEINEEEGTHKTKDGRTAKKGLYYYINKKKKEGRKANPPGHEDRPSADDFKAAAKTAKEEVIHEGVLDDLQDIVKRKSMKSVKFADGRKTPVDLTTASAMLQVYNKLNDQNKKKFADGINKSETMFMKMVDFAFTGGKRK